MRRGAIVSLVLIGAVVGLLTTGIALYGGWLPEQASTEREGIDAVFWLTTAICVGIWALVSAVIVYAVVRFRARPGDDSDGKPIHGHTGLEIVWTAVPTLLVVAIGVASTVVLAQLDSAGANPNRVGVFAQQFAWQFTYPNGVRSGELRLPVDRSTELTLTARDVIHSFWVPEFGQKQDAVPGIETRVVVTPTKEGEYDVICTELCGLGHAVMRTRAIVMSQADYDAWIAEAEQGGTQTETETTETSAVPRRRTT